MRCQLVTLLCLATLSFTAPTNQLSKRFYEENIPWKLTNITLFESSANSTLPTSINFDFEDFNPGLAIKVPCSNSVGPGEDLTSDDYFPCGETNTNVTFSYKGDQLWVHHRWQDPSLSFEPLMYQFEGGMGIWNTSFETTQTNGSGIIKTRDCAEVKCTMMD